MSKCFREYQPEQTWLLPPSLEDWLPEGHLTRFLSEVMGELDLGPIYQSYEEKDGRGQAAYEPLMMLKVLFYGYCIGIASSRRIEKATDETWRSGTWRPTSIPTTIPWRSFVADICRCWRLGLCRCSGWASRPGW